jgi:hypothetical protein
MPTTPEFERTTAEAAQTLLQQLPDYVIENLRQSIYEELKTELGLSKRMREIPRIESKLRRHISEPAVHWSIGGDHLRRH